MNILVIGSGGREHAICLAFSKSLKEPKIYCAPGNAGIAKIAECIPLNQDDINALANFAIERPVDITFVGGEIPLAFGIVDLFQSKGLKIVGPTEAAARLESSKSFAKDFMARHGIPTAKYVVAHSPGFALLELESGDFGDETKPVVVKADGLAGGKGVVVAENRQSAVAAINQMAELVGTAATDKFVLEECLKGVEVSLLAFCDGESFALMPPARDHKRVGDGDTGPNTGGMGTFTDDALLSKEQTSDIADRIIKPTLRGCVKEGFPFRGILFLGLMITAEGPKVLEYNVRFGDPETQSILARLETDLVDICEAMLRGSLESLELKWKTGASVTIVLAAAGYPSRPKTGDVITGLQDAAEIDGITILHAGTAINSDGLMVTAGGRVINVTGVGNDLETALQRAYEATGKISWNGMQYRRDIGKRSIQ